MKDELRQAHLLKLRSALAEGVEQADRGELLDSEEVIREMRAFLAARRSSSEG